MRMRAAALLLLLAAGASAEPFRVRARVFDGSSWREAAEVAVAGGVVVSIASADGPIEGTLTPGLIDLDARYGLSGGDEEVAEILATDLLLADAFAPDESEAAALRGSGVTTAWLLGGPSVVAAGASAVVQPSAAGPPRLLRRSWGLSASLATAARLPERAPTSLPDQAAALATVLGEIPGPARVRYDDGPSARQAARLGIPVGIPGRAEDLAEMRDAPALVASADWAGAGVAALGRVLAALQGSRAGFGSGDTEAGPVGVRIAAARLVEEGADPARVLRALTSDAADILGDSSRGVIAPGTVADLVLWSGDPTSLDCRPLRVWVAGEEVFRAP